MRVPRGPYGSEVSFLPAVLDPLPWSGGWRGGP